VRVARCHGTKNPALDELGLALWRAKKQEVDQRHVYPPVSILVRFRSLSIPIRGFGLRSMWMAVQPCLGIADVNRPVAIPGQVDPDGCSRPDVNVDVVAVRVEPASEPLAGPLEGTAILEEHPVGDVVDPDVSGVADLVIGIEGLRVVWGPVAGHEMERPAAK